MWEFLPGDDWYIPLFCFGQVMSATIIAPLSIALIVLLGWHIYLLLNNKTTIEVLNCIYHVKFISEVCQWNRNLKILVFVFCRDYACHVFVNICLLKNIEYVVWRFYNALHFSLHNVNIIIFGFPMLLIIQISFIAFMAISQILCVFDLSFLKAALGFQDVW